MLYKHKFILGIMLINCLLTINLTYSTFSDLAANKFFSDLVSAYNKAFIDSMIKDLNNNIDAQVYANILREVNSQIKLSLLDDASEFICVEAYLSISKYISQLSAIVDQNLLGSQEAEFRGIISNISALKVLLADNVQSMDGTPRKHSKTCELCRAIEFLKVAANQLDNIIDRAIGEANLILKNRKRGRLIAVHSMPRLSRESIRACISSQAPISLEQDSNCR